MESGFFVSKGNITKGRERYYGVKGLYYLQIGLLDSAEYWYRKELQTGRDYNNQNCSACGLSSVFLRRHLPDSVAKYSLYAYAMNDSIYAHKTTKTIERMQAMYDYSRHQEIARRESERADEEKEKRQFVALLLVIAISFTALTVYKIYSERKTHKRQYFQHIQLLEQTQQEVLSLREHEDEYKELIAEKEHLLDQLQAKVKVYQKNNWHEHSTIEHKIKESNEYKNVVNRKRERELTAEELRGCRRLIIDNLPQFSNFLIARQHLLNKTDLNVCVLFRLGFKSKEISNMLGISQARVSQISTKMMKILFDESQGGASELASLLQEMY